MIRFPKLLRYVILKAPLGIKVKVSIAQVYCTKLEEPGMRN